MTDGASSPPSGVPAGAAPKVPDERSPLTPDGMDRPRFVLDFPEDVELSRLVAAFERGNYAFVREEAPKLAARTDRPEIRAAAEELRRRIDPDPLAIYLLVASGLLLLVLVIWAYHVHP